MALHVNVSLHHNINPQHTTSNFTNLFLSRYKMSSVIYQSQKTPTDAYCCNRLQRLRQLKRIKSRIPTAETESLIHKRETYSIVDFTKYII